jgi:hypothetical protein
MSRLPANIDLSKYEEELDEEVAAADEDAEDDAYLGQSTLEKLRTGELDFGDETTAAAAPAADTTDKPAAKPRK